ncbi:nucleotide disphospho-sugar-binding domain-containing protein [Amycolatopsis regifaucium]|uniref:Protein IroB n=1 Tax=Amycolatopsis regifaucium TaxID=546365 RepID=A0A154MXZ9_9PSEU|nr:nucleotide disphospho-sugar-binding domain-containing protein [Amycolatopsis regifaucium]KZB88329.1 protein IroB [Amycolatopsis regifaucium]OKA11441.1 protein IroB [Amycolatopsis regifaucium]SFH41774.1 UDP:flavonoid glycosyltransferase YjiC, YdhE family [Amycolatopsis regifaucium]
MRVLLTAWAWPSHLYALVPMAWALRSAGHDVLLASQPAAETWVTGTGLPGATVGTDVPAADMVRRYVLPSTKDTDVPWGGAARGGSGPRAMEMFLAHAESMTGGLVELAGRWRPDLVVYDPTALAGPICAAAAGVPAVRHLYGTDLMLRARTVLPSALAPLAERHGVTGFDPFGACTIDPTPASLQLPSDYRRLPIRYLPFNGPGPLPAPPPRDRRPTVCVSWGHTMAKLHPRLFLAGSVVEVLRKLDVRVVLACSSAQLDLLGPVPDDVSLYVDAPLDGLLGHCDLLVSHGGAGSILTALSNGVPMLLVPQLPDHTAHAGRVLAKGAGEVLTRDEATDDAVATQVERLLSEPGFRGAALALREEIRAQPSPAAVVAELERVASAPAI